MAEGHFNLYRSIIAFVITFFSGGLGFDELSAMEGDFSPPGEEDLPGKAVRQEVFIDSPALDSHPPPASIR